MGYSVGAWVLLLLYRWLSATAMAGRNRPFLLQISPDQGIIVYIIVSTGPRELTEILPVYRSARARHIVYIVICRSRSWQ
jgi:hypothetical protein